MDLQTCIIELAKIDGTREWFNLLKIIIPSIVTLIAVIFAYRFALIQARTNRKAEFIEKQINEFYSPIFGCIRKLHAHDELRLELSQASNKEWKTICENSPKPFLNHEEKFEPFNKLIDYENEKISQEVIPLYDMILEIFTTKYWLAEPATREYYEAYYRFVEIWHRYLNRSIPMEVLRAINHNEELLELFYKDIEVHLEQLKDKLTDL